jgi:glutathione S-transferase
MSNITLHYFDMAGGRGEEVRLALHAAGIEFDDHRINREQWRDMKPNTPFGGLPVLEIKGKGELSQSNAILGMIGSQHDLLPQDFFEAARHIAILNACEDLRCVIVRTMRIKDDAEKQKAREELVAGYLKEWSGYVEKQIRGPFFGGNDLSVADLKLYIVMNWIKRGIIDHIPATSFDSFAGLSALFDAVVQHPKIVEWYAAHPG